ncbi:M14 family zinc carboxypeptidase [Flavobacterium turcicum]|uniref:T9SS type A sorting domain-containing protein n=1 Tax=Flavobacterium turcicum TaxID=2764718 RepID=A0ABR7JGM3_9FLAO|nr:M14 family zinc carboxypeptidase [Flavobacterium turcicum]MBC5863513.1 T9SS type A sorting domain-containing protein [Flavobacterium turcicum]NHL02537.1 T9SS type A sorting domain-containing protein [Flavobacterium turcicum]
MKKTTLLFLLLLGAITTGHTQTPKSRTENTKSQQEQQLHQRVQIPKTQTNVEQKMVDLGIDMDCGVINTKAYLQLELSAYELKKLKDAGISYKTVVTDLTKHYSERAQKDMSQAQLNLTREKRQSQTNKSFSVQNVIIGNIGQQNDCSEINFTTPSNFKIPTTFGGSLTNSGVNAELDKMRQLYPNLISVKSNISPTNQLTHQGRPIYYVKISDNPASTEAEPQVLYTGMTHSREVSSMMNTIYYMWYLLENYNTDPFIKSIVDNTELFFIPVANPDGLAWNETIAPNGGGMQRKNLRPTICDAGTTASTNNTRGVDLNRNYGYYYGLVGSSAVACDNTYRGTAAFSEPETQMMRDFVLTKNFKTALNHHAYSNLVPHPVNGKSGVPTGREREFAKLSHDMTQYNRYVYGPAPGILYAASGDASDWMTGGVNDGTGSVGSGKNTLSLSPENGSLAEGGFWPSPLSITAIAKRALRMNLIAAYYAGKYAKLHDLTQSNISALNSNITLGVERLGQTASTYTLTITPISSNITSITSPTTLSNMSILEQRNVTAALQLSPNIKANSKIEYNVKLSNGDYVLYDANFVKYYQPAVVFNDNPDTNLLSNWTQAGGTWVNASSGFTGTRSITDASTVAYANNINKTLTTATTSNLTAATRVLIQYYAKWDLERNFDLVQIQGSTNGTNWTPLCGNYTKSTSTTETNPHATKASTNNFQNTAGAGGVVYDGDQMGKWIMEEIVIDANNNSFLVGATAARFRFYMRSDSSNNTDGYTTTFDGFYVDDFKVIKIIEKSAAPIANCKNATLFLNSSGTLTVTPADINNGSTDDVAITSTSVSPNTFTCAQVNTNQNVTLTVTDDQGQTSTCIAVVTIKDALAPVAPTLSAITSKQAVTPTAPTATDNCSSTITGTTATTFPITTQGTTVVTWTFTDAEGNSSTTTQNVIIDSTAPTAPQDLLTSSTTATSTNLSWTAATDNNQVTAYEVYQNGVLRATVTGTTYTVTGLMAATNYTFTVRAKDAAGNLSANSNNLSVTTTAVAVTYCNSQGNNTTRERISRVTFNTINNSSTSSAGYENYTNISTTVLRNSAYTLSISPVWASTRYNEGYAVWIDYNGDGDFIDAGERILGRAATTASPISATITIPTTARLGATRMRVSMKFNATPTSCEVFTYGQVEDYTINIGTTTERMNTVKVTKESSSIVLYPNPVSDFIYLSMVPEKTQYKIYTILGQLVAKGKLTQPEIDVAQLSQGTYILEIENEGQLTNKKFVKN